jgi:acyl dehydratase
MQREIPIDQAKIDLYGKINGDNDIIHYDHEYCLKRGFRGTLVHGPHLSAFVCDLAMKKYGKDWFYRGKLHTKWIGPVCPGDNLIVELKDDGSVVERVKDEVTVIGRAVLEDR